MCGVNGVTNLMTVSQLRCKVRLKRVPKAYGGHYAAIVDGNGKAHAFLNAAVPAGGHALYAAICEVCGHAYAHLMGAGTVCCEECADDYPAQRSILLQRKGVPQGVSDRCEVRMLTVRDWEKGKIIVRLWGAATN